MKLPGDVLHAIFLLLHDSRVNNSFPCWWFSFDVGPRESTKYLASLALVSPDWVVPSRRVLLRTVVISFGLRQSEALSQLLRDHEYARLALRRLVVDIPPSWARMSDHPTALRLQFIILQSPSIREAHVDNVPPSLLTSDLLGGLAGVRGADRITGFGLRCVGTIDSRLLPAFIPSFTNLFSLALCGMNLSFFSNIADHHAFSRLSHAHLHFCNVSEELLTHLANLPLQTTVIGDDLLQANVLADFLIKSSDNLRQVVLANVGGLADSSKIQALRPGINLTQVNTLFPYRPDHGPSPSTFMHYRGRPVLYAVGFEISIDCHLELCARLGVKIHLPTNALPPIISRMTYAISGSLETDAIQICEDYLRQWAKRPVTIIPLNDMIVADIQNGIRIPRFYVCHVVRKLGPVGQVSIASESCGVVEEDNDSNGLLPPFEV